MSNDKSKIREFKLSSLSVDNKMTVLVLSVIISIAGFVAYRSMPKAAFPDIVVPQIYVGTPYPGNSPADIEKLITRPLEKEIHAISGVDKLTSTTISGYSTIIAEFDFKTSPTEALRKVKDAVDKAKSNKTIPDDLPTDPNIFEMNFSEFPILNVNLSGDFSMDQLRKYGEYLEDEIEQLPEISKVNIRGVQEKEVRIELDMHKMEAMELGFGDIENALRAENVTISGGELLTGNLRRTVRLSGEFTNMDQIKNMIVKNEKFNVVYLQEIAEVDFDFQERQSYAREFRKPVVMLDVVKRAGTNLIEATEKIRAIIDKSEQNEFPETLSLSITNDMSNMARNQVDNLENSIISGVILVVLVLMFFMGLRNSLFVGIAIPLSMLMGYMILGAMGVTLNIMVLFSLILVLGMLVDNGIVVVENIFRHMTEGLPAEMAAKKGAGEVAIPIISSTATTVAAFIPLLFWPGMMGEFMKYLPITLVIVLSSSLFVGLVVNPVMTARWMKIKEGINTKRWRNISIGLLILSVPFYFGKLFSVANLLACAGLIIPLYIYFLGPLTDWSQARVIPKMEDKYFDFIRFTLNKKTPLLFFFGTIFLLILSFFLLLKVPPSIVFFPINQPRYVNIFIEKPIGTDIEATNKITEEIEATVMNVLTKYNDTTAGNSQNNPLQNNFLVKSFIAQVGEGASDPSRGFTGGSTPHKARIQVSFVEYEFRRGVNTSKVLEEIREAVNNKYPGVQIFADKDQNGPPRGKPVSIELWGDDYDSLVVQAEKAMSFVKSKNVPGVEELTLDIEVGKPEIILDIDRAKARRLNISTGQIGMAIRTALFGKEVSKYKEGEDDFPINIRLTREYRYDEEKLLNQKITFRDQTTGKIKQVPVSSVATPRKSTTYSAVKRKNMQRVITVGSNVKEGFNPTATVNEIKEVMKGYKLPKDYILKFAGEQEDQAKEMGFLSKALMIAVFLVFLIIVSQFNSVSTPLIITTSVVFSLIGVLLGLVIFRMDFVIMMTMIGVISLAGVVVNNAIVLIDYTNLLFERKREELGMEKNASLPIPYLKECIIQGGKTRMRPVLLTAITTVLGLIPLATGMNINFFTLFSDFDPQIYFGGDNVIFWGPMSWTVIYGLTFATFLTLVIVPVMYYLLLRLKYKIAG